MPTIKIKVQYGADRERMVLALANNGYSVRVVEEDDPKLIIGKNYYVEFEADDRVSVTA